MLVLKPFPHDSCCGVYALDHTLVVGPSPAAHILCCETWGEHAWGPDSPSVIVSLLPPRPRPHEENEFFIDNLLVRIHFIIVMIRWTGLALWEFGFPFPGSPTSTFLASPRTSYPVRCIHRHRSTISSVALSILYEKGIKFKPFWQ